MIVPYSWQPKSTCGEGKNGSSRNIQECRTHVGRLVGPAGTIPATNKTLFYKGAGFVRFNNQDLVVEEHRYYDTAGMMAQLGLM